MIFIRNSDRKAEDTFFKKNPPIIILRACYVSDILEFKEPASVLRPQAFRLYAGIKGRRRASKSIADAF